MARKRSERVPHDVIATLRRLRDAADRVLQRTRTLLVELDTPLGDRQRLASHAPRRQKLQRSRKAG